MTNATVTDRLESLPRLQQRWVSKTIEGMVRHEAHAILNEAKPGMGEVGHRAYLPHGGFVDYAMSASQDMAVRMVAAALALPESKVGAEIQERAIKLAYPC